MKMPHVTLSIAIDGSGGDKAPLFIIDTLLNISNNSIKNCAKEVDLKNEHDQINSYSYNDSAYKTVHFNNNESFLVNWHIYCTKEHLHFYQKAGINVQVCDNPMNFAIEDVKNGNAKACISAGNTTHYAIEVLRNLERVTGIKRPALVTTAPSKPRDKVLVDVGANLQCNEYELAMFGVMGAIYAQIIHKIPNPKISFLNIGTEELKGPSYIRGARKLYEQTFNETAVFIEADEVFSSDVDVITMDGYTGNMLIKFAAGLSKFFFKSVVNIAKSSFFNKLRGLVAKPLFKQLSSLQASKHNTAVLMGVKGIVIKAHGNSDSEAFKHSLEYAVQMCEKYDFILTQLEKKAALLQKHHEQGL